ncbi:MAG: mechanosensitive ion channel [Halieaceae bacterium]|nr:mechanosensitive ion channel [Halieaceae bacterium]
MDNELPLLGIELIESLGMRLLAAIAVFLVGRWLANLATNFLKRVMARGDVEDTLEHFLGNLIYYTLMAAVVIATINQLGVETTSLLAVVGAAGLAVGLALQGSLSNFASGVMIVGFRPYKVGDYIEGGGIAGVVVEVQIFTTILCTGDNKQIIVPNSQIMAGEIINYSANSTRRIDLVAGCGYDDDIDKVRSVIEGILEAEERILDDPAPLVAVSELADSSVNFIIRPWVNSGDYWAVRRDLTEQIKKRFDAEGLTIPYPQRDVHVYKHKSE